MRAFKGFPRYLGLNQQAVVSTVGHCCFWRRRTFATSTTNERQHYQTDVRDYFKSDGLYKVLGVRNTCTTDEIKQKYRELARVHHPDRNPDPHSREMFKEITQAYQILGNEVKRAHYDRTQSVNEEDWTVDPGSLNAYTGPEKSKKGADITVEIPITIREATLGVKKSVTYPAEQSCYKCYGSGTKPGQKAQVCTACNGYGAVELPGQREILRYCDQCGGTGSFIPPDHKCTNCYGVGIIVGEKTETVSIPSGAIKGYQIRVGGKGNKGKGSPGHLFVRIADILPTHTDPESELVFRKLNPNTTIHYVEVKQTPSGGMSGTSRSPNSNAPASSNEPGARKTVPITTTDFDVELVVPLTTDQAIVGGQVTVPLLSGGTLPVQVPPFTQTGDCLILAGKGIRIPLSGYGNQFVRFFIKNSISELSSKTASFLQFRFPQQVTSNSNNSRKKRTK